VDSTDNELICLEIIHLFVELLDHYFSNVRELDLVYNFHKGEEEKAFRLKVPPPRTRTKMTQLINSSSSLSLQSL